MSDRAAAVRGLLVDIERAESAFETACERIATETDARVQDVEREREALEEAGKRARDRAERAERTIQILREEREVIRKALRAVTGAGGATPEASGDGPR